MNAAIGKRAGLHPTIEGESFGEGPGAVPDQRLPDATLHLEDLRLPHRTVIMRPLDEDCLFGTVLLDHFVVEIDYLAAAIRLYAANAYRPTQGAISVPLTVDRYKRPMIIARLVLQGGDAVTARLLLDSAIPDYTLSLTKPFTDKESILKRVHGS